MRSFTVFAAVAAFLPAVFAQATVPTCVVSCIGQGAALTQCQSADAECLCASQTFIEGASSCMIQTCDSKDLAIGVQFGEQYCASVGVVVTIPSSLDGATESATSTSAEPTANSAAASSTATFNSSSASSAVSSAASSASESIAASGTTGAAAAASPTSAASSVYAASALGLVGVGAAALLF